MKLPRGSGVLLHPTSLPGGAGIGDLGDDALKFVDFLAQAKQRIWQVLPLGPTGYGDSPYQCFSAFAGNPLLISLEGLVRAGDLDARDVPRDTPGPVDFGAVYARKVPLLRKAAARFAASATPSARADFESFCDQQAAWLDDYALFMALKDAHSGRPFSDWDDELISRQPAAIARAWRTHADQVRVRKYEQHRFFQQWHALKSHAHARGVEILGDLPIFIAHDSADVWAHRDLFDLDARARPRVQAGVPPDYFSATGQLWGNPLYRWDALEATGYAWWIERFRRTLAMVDIVRVDHFRGFVAYWEVPGADTTAVNGRWVIAPGHALFRAVTAALGELRVVAENLGVITPPVEALRHELGFPGMAILQFAFGTDPQAPTFLPHHYERDLVVYTGTHDNDTVMGWWQSEAGQGSTRTAQDIEREHDYVKKYLGTDGSEMNWVLIRAVLASVARLAVIPAQDLLGLGSPARMNLPATSSGNWRFRLGPGELSPRIAARLGELTHLYGRATP